MSQLNLKTTLSAAQSSDDAFTSASFDLMNVDKIVVTAGLTTGGAPTGGLTLEVSEDKANWVAFGDLGTLAVPLVTSGLCFRYGRVKVAAVVEGVTYDLVSRAMAIGE